MSKIKVLNLYAGIGGNRWLWENVEVTAVEINPEIAEVYQKNFPNDKVIVGDAHQLSEHHGIPLPECKNQRLLLRNCVNPNLALHIFNCANKNANFTTQAILLESSFNKDLTENQK